MMDLSPRVALIADIMSPIGASTALCLARNGMKICIVGNDRQIVQSLESQCNRLSCVKCLSLVADLQKDQLASNYVLRRVIETYGRLDSLVMCTTNLIQPTDTRDLSSLHRYKTIIRSNLDIPMQLTLLAVQYLEKSRGNMTFVSCLKCCKPSSGSYAHCISSSGLRKFVKCLALDLTPHVRVNMVSIKPSLSGELACDNCKNSYPNNSPVSDRKLEELAQTIYQLVSDETASLTNGNEIVL